MVGFTLMGTVLGLSSSKNFLSPLFLFLLKGDVSVYVAAYAFNLFLASFVPMRLGGSVIGGGGWL